MLDNYKDRDKLAVFLSNFDCVILANVAAEQVSEEQQEMIRSNTHDQGCGLVMIGGPDSFGAGGWQDTPVEKALPVDCEIKSLKVQGKGGLVLIMHASEMADGNFWQKKIAKLAIERLGPADEVGVIDSTSASKWHIPLQEIGDNRDELLAQIDKLHARRHARLRPGLADGPRRALTTTRTRSWRPSTSSSSATATRSAHAGLLPPDEAGQGHRHDGRRGDARRPAGPGDESDRRRHRRPVSTR